MTQSRRQHVAASMTVLVAAFWVAVFSFDSLPRAQAASLPSGKRSPTQAPTQTVRRRCGTLHPPTATVATVENHRIATQAAERAVAAASNIKNVTVIFHVITHGNLGRLGIARLQAQVDMLNAAFQGTLGSREDTGFRFLWNTTSGVDYTDNAAWFRAQVGSAEEAAMKAALKRGGSVDLDIYTANPGGGLLGWAYYPWDYKSDPQLDGIILSYQTFPGGPWPAFSQGKTAVHETGHWLGLYHTFQGGCSIKYGDWVADTVPEKSGASGCPLDRKSCVGPSYPAAWRDPVTNFLDYSDDKCMKIFTPGQATRMDFMWRKYRYCASCQKLVAQVKGKSKTKS